MGASDFVAGDFYTYDDLPAGQTDYAMTHFWIAHDRDADPAAAAPGPRAQPATSR